MNWDVRFIETVGAWDVMVLAIKRKDAFCMRVTVPGRVVLRALCKLGAGSGMVRRLEIGHVTSAKNVRKSAYEMAEDCLQEQPLRPWADRVGAQFDGLRLSLLVEKLLFERLYERCCFYELCLRYADENPAEQISCNIDVDDASVSYAEQLSARANILVSQRRLTRGAEFLGALFALPALIVYHWIWFCRSDDACISDAVVCSVDDVRTHEMMQHLFCELPSVRYVAEPEYLPYLPAEFVGQKGVEALRLGRRDLIGFVARLPRYCFYTIVAWPAIGRYGALPLLVFHLLLKASQITPSGRNICFVTSGHLTIERAARNELLRCRGSVSVNISKNSYVTYQQLPAERQLNYDLFAASGQHAIDLYRRKKALSTLICTGSYEAHRPLAAESAAVKSRRDRLRQFKENRRLVVFLSPGICEETLSHERRLMALAARIGSREDVRVVVRKKPVDEPSGFERFYEDAFHGNSRVWMTGGEFDLFDFVGVADLFVTSISTSAFDVALRGGKVVFIDFMQTPSLYIAWEKMPTMVLSESSAYKAIEQWLVEGVDETSGVGSALSVKNIEAYVGRQFPDFEAYRAHLLESLNPWLHRAHKGRADLLVH